MSPNPRLEVLRGARVLIAQGWTQRSFARDSTGSTVEPSDPAACVWCLLGALGFAGLPQGRAGYGSGAFVTSAIAMRDPEKRLPGSLASWNDAEGRTQAEVLAVLDEAIAIAAGEPGRSEDTCAAQS